MSQCKVLGAIRAFDSGGLRLTLASEAQRRLLAMLCLRAHTTVRSVVLEEHLGLSPGALRTSISRLRRVIGAENLVSDSAGYELKASVDAVDYERLVNEAFLSDAERARLCLEQAGALWDGPPYDEFAHEPWAEIEARRLGELHAAAVEELVLLLLEAGESAGAIAALLPLIEQQPYRDLPRALHMRALDQAGRRTDALRHFQSYRLVLQGEIGTEPSAPRVELDRAIASAADLELLRSSGHPAWTRRRGLLTGVAATKRPSVPIPLSSFVGRVQEMAELGALLKKDRIVTLTGSGGCGKSRLAIRIASTARERDGTDAWWVDLGVLAPTANVAEQIATEIGVVPRHDVIGELERRLRGKRSLLVLDNAEHVLDATAAVLAALLTRCPDTSALITSRQPLGLAGEVVWRVPELTMPDESTAVTLDNFDRHDALRLFLVRAREARPGMVVDRQAIGYIASICRELDGMPLALELAAARLRSVPLPTVAAGIAEIIRWRVGDRAKPARHATLRASIEWSFGLISRFEQRVLVCLAAFHSPFDSEAAASVITAIDHDDGPADDGAIAGDHLGRLTDVGLLQLDDSSGRYRMLNIVRQFCTELGRATGDLARAEQAHAQYFARWCAVVGEGRLGIEHHPFVRRMPDIVAASLWARSNDDRAAVFAICRGLAPVRSALGHHADFVATWAWLRAIDPTERSAPWAEAVAALLPTATSQLYETASVVDEILVHVGSGSGRALAWLERGRAMVPAYRGQLAAIHAYAESLLARGDDLEASVYVGFAAYMHALVGRLDRCDSLLDQLRRLTRRHGCTFSVDSVGNGYAAAIVAETVRGDLASALDRGKRPGPDRSGILSHVGCCPRPRRPARGRPRHDASSARLVDPRIVSLVGVPYPIHGLLCRAARGRCPRSGRVGRGVRGSGPRAGLERVRVARDQRCSHRRRQDHRGHGDHRRSRVACRRNGHCSADDRVDQPWPSAGSAGTRRTRRSPPTRPRRARRGSCRAPAHRRRRRARSASRRQRTTRPGLSVVDRDCSRSRASALGLRVLHRSGHRGDRTRRGRRSPRCVRGDHRAR